jgi:hypothetical protein
MCNLFAIYGVRQTSKFTLWRKSENKKFTSVPSLNLAILQGSSQEYYPVPALFSNFSSNHCSLFRCTTTFRGSSSREITKLTVYIAFQSIIRVSLHFQQLLLSFIPPTFTKVVIPFVINLLENSTIVTRYNNYNILDLTYETDERTFAR